MTDLSIALLSFKRKVYWLFGFLLVLCVLYNVREALVVVFTAFIFASALLPTVEWLDRKLPRWLAVILPLAVLLLIGVGIVLPVATLAFQQLQYFSNDIPRYLDEFKHWAGQWSFISRRYPFLTRFNPAGIEQFFALQNAMMFSGFTGLTLAISQVGLDLLSALVISVFMLLDREKIETYFLRFRPAKDHPRLRRLIDHLIRSTGAFVSGQILFMVSFGGLIAAGLSWIGLPFPVLLGSLAGLLTLIPIVGANIALVPTLLIAVLTPGGWVSALWVFLLFVAVQVVQNNVIGPWIMGRAVGLHPLAIILAIMVGGMLFGLVGIILAIPLATCLNIILEEWFMDPEHRASRVVLPAEPTEGGV